MKAHMAKDEAWLITGGLGYIGAHVAREFIASGYKVIIVDNLSTGLIDRLPSEALFIECDVRNSDAIHKICNEFKISGVIHLAAFKHARESRLNPAKYFSNNVGGTLGLAEGLLGTSVKKVIISSSCSVYGNAMGVDDASIPNPQSPYALSKLYSEEILRQSLNSIEIAFTSLRFFNVIGCDNFTRSHDQSMECLVPVIQEKIKKTEPIEIYGVDLNTPDGTCLRDYLDVTDIARAHVVVANAISGDHFPASLNLSSGFPTSVKEIINEFESLLGEKIAVVQRDKNPADPIAIWAEKSTFLAQLGWKPLHSIKDSIQSHYNASLRY